MALTETELMIRRLAEKLWSASRKESRIARTVVLKLKTSADLNDVPRGLEEALQCLLNGLIVLDDQDLFHQDLFYQGVIVVELLDIRYFLLSGLLRPPSLPEHRALMDEVFSQAKPDVSLASKEFARTLQRFQRAPASHVDLSASYSFTFL